MPRQLLLTGVLLLASGCVVERTYTIVEKHLEPHHFQFVTIVTRKGPSAGGWRAACLHLKLQHKGGPIYLCKMGIEMPMHTKEEGPISLPLAQRIATDCANLAADMSLSATTPETPLGLACESFKKAFNLVLYGAVKGSHVMQLCEEATEPVVAP